MRHIARAALAAAALSAAIFAAWTPITGGGGVASAQSEPEGAVIIRPVKVATLAVEAERPTRRFFGRIVARSTVDLAFQVGGEITVFGIEEGERVPAGAVLAQLDLEPYELALRSAELALEQADRAYQRLERLGPQTTSQASIDDAETARDLAAVTKRQAERDLENATLTAPFDLLAASRYVDAFTTIQPGQQIIRVHDMGELRIDINVPEIIFRSAQGPEDFNLYAELVGDDATYPLIPREFNAETSEIGQSFVITLAFAGEADSRLLPGATVTVVAEPVIKSPAIYLPAAAVIIDPDQSLHVMVYEPIEAEPGYGVARKTAIEIETGEGQRLKVVSGVAPGDHIVAAGPGQVDDGEKVRRFEGFGE